MSGTYCLRIYNIIIIYICRGVHGIHIYVVSVGTLHDLGLWQIRCVCVIFCNKTAFCRALCGVVL